MNSPTLVIVLIAVVALTLGALMLFAQHQVRLWWASRTGKSIDSGRPNDPSEDPVRYAFTIFGMMLFAFGILILGFFTAFEYFRA